MHCETSLVAPCRLFLPEKPPLPPAGSVLFCSASPLRKTLPAQPQNGLLSSSHPPALDLPAREAGQPTPAGSCLTALSCGLPGCRSLPPARCCLHPARTADSPGACLHPLRPRRQELGAVCGCSSPEVLASGQGAVGALGEQWRGLALWASLHLVGLLLLAVPVSGSQVLLPLRTPFVPQ